MASPFKGATLGSVSILVTTSRQLKQSIVLMNPASRCRCASCIQYLKIIQIQRIHSVSFDIVWLKSREHRITEINLLEEQLMKLGIGMYEEWDGK